MFSIDLSVETAEILIEYLQAHEQDIATGMNDFGDLIPVFFEFIGRQPETD